MHVSTAINAGTLIVRSINNLSNNFLKCLKQQIQEHYLSQQQHLVLICFAERFLGGANVTLLSSPSHLVFIFCVETAVIIWCWKSS